MRCLDEESQGIPERKEKYEDIGFRVEKLSTWRHAKLNAPSGWRLPTISECAQVLEQIDYKDLWDHEKVQLSKSSYCWTAVEYSKDSQYAEVVSGVGNEREIALRLKWCKLRVIYVEDL